MQGFTMRSVTYRLLFLCPGEGNYGEIYKAKSIINGMTLIFFPQLSCNNLSMHTMPVCEYIPRVVVAILYV